MSGEHSYSTEAVQALCDTYYGNPGTRVETIRTQAAAAQLENTSPHVQREIASISRAQCFELLRKDPRHHGNTRVALEQLWNDICEDLAYIDEMPNRSLSQAMDRDKRRRSILHTIRLYDEATAAHKQQPTPQPSAGLLASLTANTD